MTQHQEVPVKVNAWVDAGIADLVSALSEIDGLVTLESRQGDAARRNAFVMFRFGSWRDCGELLFERMMMAAMDDDLRSDMIRPIILLPPTTLSGRLSALPAAISMGVAEHAVLAQAYQVKQP